MSQFHVSESRKASEVGNDSNVEVQTEKAPKSYTVNPRELMIQVIHRSGEQIHPSIIEASYTWVDQGVAFQRIEDPFCGWIHITRNYQTQLFLQRPELKYLFMIDADEAVPWWVPFQLMEHALPIVSGVVCGFNHERGLFACVAVKGPDGKAYFPSETETKSIPARGVQEVHNAGTGALMLQREVLEKMWLKYEKKAAFGQPFSIPIEEQDIAAKQGALPRGEDICFTDRARQLGYAVNVDWECKIPHRKAMHLNWPPHLITNLDPKRWARMAFPKAKMPGKKG